MRKHQTKFFYLFIGLGLLFSCSKESGEDIANQQVSIITYLTANKLAYQEIGDIYKVVKIAGYGYGPTYGDTVTFNYSLYEYNDTRNLVITSNVSDTLVKHGFDTEIFKPGPTKIVLGEGSFLSGISQGLLSMHAGEVCDIFMTSNLGYGDQQRGPVAGNTMLRARMQIISVNGSSIISEKQKIAEYIANNTITISPKDEGYYFIQDIVGVGSMALVGDTTYVSYVCKTLAGDVVEEVFTNDSLNFIVGGGKAPVVGIDLAVRLMASGATATVIMPSYLAYGRDGKINSLILPYETLIYDVNLYKIKTKK